MTDKKRGTGRTTKQMQDSPLGSIFIWHHSDLTYPKELSKNIGRSDLKIVSPNWLLTGWRGVHLSGLVVDHFAYKIFTEEMLRLVEQALLRVKVQP